MDKNEVLALLISGLSKEEVAKRATANFVEQDIYETPKDAKWAAQALVDEIYIQLQLVSGADATSEPIWDSEVLRNEELTYEDLQRNAANAGFFTKEFWKTTFITGKKTPAPVKFVTGTDPVTGQAKEYKLLWDEKIGNYVDPDNLGPIYDVVPSSDETVTVTLPNGESYTYNKIERDFIDGKVSYEDAYTLVLVDHLDKHKAKYGMFGPDAGAIDETLSGKLFIPGSTSEDTTLTTTGTFSDRLAAAEAAQSERDRIARNLKNYAPDSNKNWLDTGVTQSEYKKRIDEGFIWDKVLGWMNPTEENKNIVRKEFSSGDAKEYINKTPVKKVIDKKDDDTTPPTGGQPPAGQDPDTKAKTGEVKQQSDIKITPSFTPSPVTELPGLTGQRAAEMGTSPAQVAAGLPALLPGGTSPFARASYGGILGNLASAFKLVGTAMPSLFSTPDLAGMYGAADDPKAFAKFISQKPEDIKSQIAESLRKLEEVKEIVMKDPNNPALESGSMFDLKSGFIDDFGANERDARMAIAGFGKPRWLRDSIDQAYLDKYNQARLTNPLAITQPGFYSDTFADKPDLVNQDNTVSGNDKSNTLGNNTGSTPQQVQQYELSKTKSFQPGDVGGQGPDEQSLLAAAPTDTTDSMTALKTAMSGSGGGPASLALGGMSQANPEVGAGMMGGGQISSAKLTPSPQDATQIAGGTFIDPTTYYDPRFRPETYIAQGMSVDAANTMASQAFQDFTNQRRLDQGLVQRTDAEGNLLPFWDRPPVTGEVSQSFTPTSGGTEIGMGAPPVGDPIDVGGVAGNVAKAALTPFTAAGNVARQLGKGVVSNMESIGLPPYKIPTRPFYKEPQYPAPPLPLPQVGINDVRRRAKKTAEDELDELLAMMGGSYDGGRGAM